MGGVILLAGVPDWIRRGVGKSQQCTSIHVFLIPEYESNEASPLIHLSSQLEPFSAPPPYLPFHDGLYPQTASETKPPFLMLLCQVFGREHAKRSRWLSYRCLHWRNQSVTVQGSSRIRILVASILLHARVLGSIKANPGNPQGQYALWCLPSLLMYWSGLTKQQTVAMLKKNRFYLYLVRLPVCVRSHQRTPCRYWFSPLSLRYQT